MSDNIVACQTISTTIGSIYSKLTTLPMDIDNPVSHSEQIKYLNMLKQLIPEEASRYALVSLDEIEASMDDLPMIIANTTLKSLHERRFFMRLMEQMFKLGYRPMHDGVLLTVALHGKLYIDALQSLLVKLDDFVKNKTFSTDEYNKLMAVYRTMLYEIVTDNSCVESTCLQHDFDIGAIDNVSFDDIQAQYQMSIELNIQAAVYTRIDQAIAALNKLTFENKYHDAIISLFNTAMVENCLQYASSIGFLAILTKYNDDNFGNTNNAALMRVKKLIEDKRSEFM